MNKIIKDENAHSIEMANKIKQNTTYTFIICGLFCPFSFQLNCFHDSFFDGIIFLLSQTVIIIFHNMPKDMQT